MFYFSLFWTKTILSVCSMCRRSSVFHLRSRDHNGWQMGYRKWVLRCLREITDLSLSLCTVQSSPPVCSPSPTVTVLSGPYVNTFINAAMAPVRVEMCPDGGTPLCRPGQHSRGEESWCVGWGSGLTGLFLSMRVAEFWHATVPRLRLQVRSCRPCQTCCFFVACQPHEPWTD